MAEYKGIVGTKIRNYTTNPDNPITGEVWYNETDQVLKFSYPNTTTSGSWATGGNLNTARTNLTGSGISNSSALAIGGGDATGSLAVVESYDGASWTEVGDLNLARQNLAAAGTQTSALATGGFSNPPQVFLS